MDWKIIVVSVVSLLVGATIGVVFLVKQKKIVDAFKKQNFDLFTAVFIYTTLYGDLTDENIEESAKRVEKYGAEVFIRQIDRTGVMGGRFLDS